LQWTVIEFLMSFGAIAMSYPGHIENGTVVFDTQVPWPTGTPVNVEAVTPNSPNDPSEESAEEWVAKLYALAASQPICDWFVDDSRESIYEGRGE
jgi:hypothetical protein